MAIKSIGAMPDGSPIQSLELSCGDLRASVISYGAALQSLQFADLDYSLVLGFERAQDYLDYSQHYGANCGPVANRIAGARLELAGVDYQLEANFLGKHCLHGGSRGYSKRNWRIGAHSSDSVCLELIDPAGAGGFPGALEVSCTYRLVPPATLQLSLTARALAHSVCNLAHHSYFCLDANGDVRDHLFRIDADSYLPVDSELIPTGVVAPVAGSGYDLRHAKPLRADIEQGLAYDHNYCLASKRRALQPVAWVYSPQSGVELELATTEAGLQFYAGANIDSKVPGLHARVYRPYSGFCLEPQFWPAANSYPHFPSIELAEGELYEQKSSFGFSKV